MKIKLLFFILLFVTGFISAQTQYPLVTIHEIQYLPDSVIAKGDAPSPLIGDTVRVRGVMLVAPLVNAATDRRRIIAAGPRWTAYMEEENGQPWGGINVIQHDTTGENQGTFFDLVDTAQVVEFTVVIEEYYTSTQAALLLKPVTPVSIISTLPKRPDPIELSVTDFMENGKLKFEAEKYEGMYVIIRNVISSDRNASSGTFKINDDKGNFMFMYDQSGYFTNRSHRLTGITNYEPPQDGTPINFIRGVISTRTDGYYIVPLYPGDISITATPPVISSIRRDSALVKKDQAVKVSASIIDLDGFVKEAKLRYRVDGGAYNELTMAPSQADTSIFEATIPAVNKDSALVDYYIKAVDNDNRVSVNPGDTVKGNYFYLVLDRPVTIKDVQYSPLGSGYSGFNNYRVTLTGVVTSDTTGAVAGMTGISLRTYIQDGSGPWSGIQLGSLGQKAVEVLSLRRGDNVTINGLIMESNSVTKIDSITSIVVNSSNNLLPDPVEISTADIDALSSGDVSAEQWEGVLVKYKNVTVTDDNADGNTGPDEGSGGNRNFGEIEVADTSNVSTRVELQEGNHIYHNLWDASLKNIPGNIQITEGGKFSELRGIMGYSYGNYKLLPRKNDDFVGYTTGVNDNKYVTPKSYSLKQNYPNPFNPATTISYSIPVNGVVTLKIYNLLGQEVKTLINKEQAAGNYKVSFNAEGLSSGIYFYSLNAGSFRDIKKMILLK